MSCTPNLSVRVAHETNIPDDSARLLWFYKTYSSVRILHSLRITSRVTTLLCDRLNAALAHKTACTNGVFWFSTQEQENAVSPSFLRLHLLYQETDQTSGPFGEDIPQNPETRVLGTFFVTEEFTCSGLCIKAGQEWQRHFDIAYGIVLALMDALTHAFSLRKPFRELKGNPRNVSSYMRKLEAALNDPTYIEYLFDCN